MASMTATSGNAEVNAAELLLMLSSGWNSPEPRQPTAPATVQQTVSGPSQASQSSIATKRQAPAPPTTAHLRPRRAVAAAVTAWTDPPTPPSEEDVPRHRNKPKRSGTKDIARNKASSVVCTKQPRTSMSSASDLKKTGKKLLERLAEHMKLKFLKDVDGAAALTPEQFDMLGLTEDELLYYNSRAERDKTKALFKIFFCQREELPIVPTELACKRCKNDSWACYLRWEMAEPRRGRKMKSCAGCHASKAECIWSNKQNDAPDFFEILALHKGKEASTSLPTPPRDSKDLPQVPASPKTRKTKAKKVLLPTPPPDAPARFPDASELPQPLPRSVSGKSSKSTGPSNAPSGDSGTSRSSSLAPNTPRLLAPSPVNPVPNFVSRGSTPIPSAQRAVSYSALTKRGRTLSADDLNYNTGSLSKRSRTISPVARPHTEPPKSTKHSAFWTVGSSKIKLAASPRRPPHSLAAPSRARAATMPPSPTTFLSPATEADYRSLSARGIIVQDALISKHKCTRCTTHNLTCAFVNLPTPVNSLIPLRACIESANVHQRSFWRFHQSNTTGTTYLSARVGNALLPPTMRAVEDLGAWCDPSDIRDIAAEDTAAQLALGLEDTLAYVQAVKVIQPYIRAIAPALGLSLSPRPIDERERYLLALNVNQRARATHMRRSWNGLDILQAVEAILVSEITPALAHEVVSRLPGWDGEKVMVDNEVKRLIVVDGEMGVVVERGREVHVIGHQKVLRLPEFARATKAEAERMDVMAVFGQRAGTRHWCASVIAHDQVLLGEVLDIIRRGGVDEVLSLVDRLVRELS